ncbi:hypothetical protein [Variovorax sp. PBS-H4]|uniref:hypothetical protein n=1 Tax=Variovorax sp. PBS-H4 TaxID=434008 RepID=UPI0013A5A703|nr:hypothetical protein [Variovorax sp. PBS-H4]
MSQARGGSAEPAAPIDRRAMKESIKFFGPSNRGSNVKRHLGDLKAAAQAVQNRLTAAKFPAVPPGRSNQN